MKRLLSIRDTEGFPPKVSSYMINALLEESRRLCFRDDSLVRHLKDLQRQTRQIECDIDVMLASPHKEEDKEKSTAQINVKQAWVYIVDNILDFPVSSPKISAFEHSVARARAWSYRYQQHAISIANSKKKKKKKKKKRKKRDKEIKEAGGGRQYHHNRNRNHQYRDNDDDDNDDEDNSYVSLSIEPLESLLAEGKQLSFSLPQVEKLEHDIRCLKWKKELEIYLKESAR